MTEENMGPSLPFSRELHAQKYRVKGESFRESTNRVASALTDSPEHFQEFRRYLQTMRFLPGGRVQAGVGTSRKVTAMNCFVSSTIHDDSQSIMDSVFEAYKTLRMGGGIGYDFSRLRPRGTLIKSLDSQASGPVSFMEIFDAVCRTVQSAGHRRGAQMGVLRCDHPDIEEFIHAKQDQTSLTAFNISVAVTDEFMSAVRDNGNFDLRFEGEVYRTVRARDLWESIMRSTYDWAEPGVLFVDRINKMNNLYYCEEIEATNPCGEQPLAANASCLLGSQNLTRYVDEDQFSWSEFVSGIPHIVRAMDNIIDIAHYPLEKQRQYHLNTRRMGLGVTGLANTLERFGHSYGSAEFVDMQREILTVFRDEAYRASVELAKEKGPFPLFDRDKYVDGEFVKTLPEALRQDIYEHGIRNSHLLSIAPTGTISLTADNVSSGIEPVFAYQFDRVVQEFNGSRTESVQDYGYRVFGVQGKQTDDVTIDEHLAVLLTAQELVDSAVSKTCNVPTDISWEDFKSVYMKAWEGGAKGCTTYRSGGKREGILKSESTGACYIDPDTGRKECD